MPKPKAPKTFFMDAPNVEEIASQLIEEHHRHLVNAKIKFLKRYGNWKAKGKTRLGSAEKVSEKHKYLTGYDFIIIINGIVFDSLRQQEKEALVDHELCHCGVTDKDEFCIWPHDLEDFIAIVRRHGLWMEELKRFADVAIEASRQLTIFDYYPEERQVAVV
ncbi:MAG: hypothetical protein A4E53_02383 [Pelotomaculum sp. PtaB.Bin104]|nr:MAG: hypothetical protein A4E53_02383 [Pelotomaculum sp. PtaB.Bin104]